MTARRGRDTGGGRIGGRRLFPGGMETLNAEIIAVGTELLLGNILNTNAQYLAEQLAALGMTVHYQTVVGDNAERLAGVLRTAKARSALLVVCGGLGPTADDLTKQTAAAVFGDTLVEDKQELARLQDYFAARGLPMTPNNARQALVPAHGGKFVNDNGTAPGILLHDGDRWAVLLPGPPSELRPMFERQVLPWLRSRQQAALVSRWLHVVGVPESELDDRLARQLNADNPTVALYAKTGEVHIRVTARAADRTAAAALADAAVQQLCQTLGSAVYSTDGSTLEATVLALLRRRGLRLTCAESCTGGLLAQRLTSVPGASEAFDCGIVSYSEAIKQKLLGVRAETLAAHTVYSASVAAQMARGAAALAGADLAVGITGIAGPGGALPGIPVGTVFIGLYDARPDDVRCRVLRLYLPGRSRDEVRWRAAQAALDLVRRAVLGLPLEDTCPAQP